MKVKEWSTLRVGDGSLVANGADITLKIVKSTLLSLFLFDVAVRLNAVEVRPYLGRGRNDFGSHFGFPIRSGNWHVWTVAHLKY